MKLFVWRSEGMWDASLAFAIASDLEEARKALREKLGMFNSLVDGEPDIIVEGQAYADALVYIE